MNAKWEASKRKLLALARRHPASSQDYRTALLQLLRECLPFDGACCTAVDPQTLLSTGAITEDGVEAIHHGIFEHEYLREDFIRYEQLSRAAEPVATLYQATGGELAKSERYRNVLLPAGFADELRAALKYDGACWGFLTLFRFQGRPVFSEEEREWMAELAPLIAYHLRKTALSLPAEDTSWMEEETGIVMMSERLAIHSANATADRWLSLLRRWESIDRHILPRPVRAVCFRALAQLNEPAPQSLHGQSVHPHAGRPVCHDSGKPDARHGRRCPPRRLVRSGQACRYSPAGLRSVRIVRTGKADSRPDRPRLVHQGAGPRVAHLRLYGAGSFEVDFRENGGIQQARADLAVVFTLRGGGGQPRIATAIAKSLIASSLVGDDQAFAFCLTHFQLKQAIFAEARLSRLPPPSAPAGGRSTDFPPSTAFPSPGAATSRCDPGRSSR